MLECAQLRMQKHWGAFTFLVLLAVLVAACGSPAAPTPAPQELVKQAASRLVQTRSLHFAIEFTGAPTYLDKGRTLSLRRVEGDVVRPDRMRATVKAALPGAFVQILAIGIGDDQYATNPLNGQWQKIPAEWGFNPTVLFESERGLAAILADVQNLAVLPEETIENQRHFHISGALPGSKIAPLTGWLVGAGNVRFELWVGAQDSYVRRIRLIDESASSNSAGATPSPPAQWNMDLSKFDVPVTIDPPL